MNGSAVNAEAASPSLSAKSLIAKLRSLWRGQMPENKGPLHMLIAKESLSARGWLRLTSRLATLRSFC
jgi:hypothetical protein